MEEDIELLEEMKANCIKGMMKGAIYTDPKAERKALAIDNLIKGYRELEERIISLTNLLCINDSDENYIPKSKIKEIRDKAEVMDYYVLGDVIEDLNKLLGDEK